MSVQLSMTLAVGFVLLFVNIIAFAIVSYRKEQDKIVIEVKLLNFFFFFCKLLQILFFFKKIHRDF